MRCRLASVAIAGRPHRLEGEACQDDAACVRIEGGPSALLVADGAGSSQYGERGAKLAIATASDLLEAGDAVPLDFEAFQSLALSLFDAVRAALSEVAGALGTVPRQLATTLAVAYCGESCVYFAQVGDALGVVLDEDARIAGAMIPMRGEFINQATFVTSEGWRDAVQFHAYEGAWSMASLQSDGLQGVTLNRGVPFEPFYAAVAELVRTADSVERAIEELTPQLESEEILLKCSDDVSLAVAVR